MTKRQIAEMLRVTTARLVWEGDNRKFMALNPPERETSEHLGFDRLVLDLAISPTVHSVKAGRPAPGALVVGIFEPQPDPSSSNCMVSKYDLFRCAGTPGLILHDITTGNQLLYSISSIERMDERYRRWNVIGLRSQGESVMIEVTTVD